MKTIKVVAAVIKKQNKVFVTEVTENLKMDGNFLEEKLSREKHRRKR